MGDNELRDSTKDLFQVFATRCSQVAGSRLTFVTAVLLIILWAVTGPFFHYSDAWQLVVNTATTIITFLMVFLIQNAQNRDSHALHLKLDEIIRSLRGANNEMIDIEKLSDQELAALATEYQKIRDECESRNRGRVSRSSRETNNDTGTTKAWRTAANEKEGPLAKEHGIP